jgi:hypothetical protein
VPARGQQEMPFEQGLAGAEFGEHVVILHCISSPSRQNQAIFAGSEAPGAKIPLEALETGRKRAYRPRDEGVSVLRRIGVWRCDTPAETGKRKHGKR